MNRVNTLLIRTPEGIVFAQPLASPVTRFLAWAIDFACIVVVSWVLSTATAIIALVSLDLAQALGIIAYFVVSVGYGMLLEWYWRGQTVGKRLLRLRVVDGQGLRLQPSQVIIRNLLRFVDLLPAFYLLGGVSCLLSGRNQRLGDIAASTVVVRQPRIHEPDLEQLLTGKFNSLRAYPHLEARLRQRVSPAEAGLALRALLRRDSLEAGARLALFAEIAGHFRAKVTFPPEATEGITDEQYVRNVVDVLYKRRETALPQKLHTDLVSEA
jgi:uncharacterized RDD family membrane protein YckC